MNKKSLIDRLVRDKSGVWPQGWATACYDKRTNIFSSWPPRRNPESLEHVCTQEEFTQHARELGWINGYKYGVEYPTNGKKPDLPDDFIVTTTVNDSRGWLEPSTVSTRRWELAEAFRIVGERYKPKQPAYASRDEMAKHSIIGDMQLDNSWHERGELPPVGTECEVSNCGSDFVWCKIKYMGSHICVVQHRNYNDQHYHLSGALRFRPIKTEREKFVDAGVSGRMFHRLPKQL